MRILLSFLICCFALSPRLAQAFEWSMFEAKMVQESPVFLHKNHKEAECHVTPGMLGVDQLASTKSALNTMYDYDYKGIGDAFTAAFASKIAMGSEVARLEAEARARTVAPDLAAKQKQENVARSQDTPAVACSENAECAESPCAQNPLGYVFGQSDFILGQYSGMLEMEQRNLARGVTEDLAFADIALGNMGRNANFSIENGFDDEQVASFRLIPSVLAGENKNPRPQSLDPSKVSDARYLTREAGLSVYRSLMSQPWREYQISRMKLISFRLIRDWTENLYKVAMDSQDESLDDAPSSSGGVSGDPSAPVSDSGAELNKMPTLSMESCNHAGWGTIRSRCKPGMEVGKPNPDLVALTQKNPEVYSLVQKYGGKHNVPVDFLSALIGLESGGGSIDVKPNQWGVAGVGQQKAETMEDVANYLKDNSFRVTCNWANPQCDPRMDKAKSVEAAAVYLKMQMNRYNNDMLKAVLAYNQGPKQPECYARDGTRCNGSPMTCEGKMYTMNLMCIPATALLEGVKLKLPEGYEGEPVRDVGQDVLPPVAEGEEPMRTDVHVLTEGEYKRYLSADPLWNDMTMLSQEQVYDYLAQFFSSDAYTKLVDKVNTAGTLKLRLPMKTMKYRLWDRIRKDIQLGSTLDALADIPEYQDSLKQVEALFDRRGGR